MKWGQLKLIVPAGDLPDGAVVTKVTGQKKFVIKRVLTIYYEPSAGPAENKRTIPAEAGCVFLVDGDGNANAVGAEKEVKWVVGLDQLNYLHDEEFAQ